VEWRYLLARMLRGLKLALKFLGLDAQASKCRGTSRIRNIARLGPYSRTMTRALWQS